MAVVGWYDLFTCPWPPGVRINDVPACRPSVDIMITLLLVLLPPYCSPLRIYTAKYCNARITCNAHHDCTVELYVIRGTWRVLQSANDTTTLDSSTCGKRDENGTTRQPQLDE